MYKYACRLVNRPNIFLDNPAVCIHEVMEVYMITQMCMCTVRGPNSSLSIYMYIVCIQHVPNSLFMRSWLLGITNFIMRAAAP